MDNKRMIVALTCGILGFGILVAFMVYASDAAPEESASPAMKITSVESPGDANAIDVIRSIRHDWDNRAFHFKVEGGDEAGLVVLPIDDGTLQIYADPCEGCTKLCKIVIFGRTLYVQVEHERVSFVFPSTLQSIKDVECAFVDFDDSLKWKELCSAIHLLNSAGITTITFSLAGGRVPVFVLGSEKFPGCDCPSTSGVEAEAVAESGDTEADADLEPDVVGEGTP